jgi:class 3 adenylate cyclase
MAGSQILRKIVLVVDICSSTAILEDLKQTDNLKEWEDFLTALQSGLEELRDYMGMEIYKFIGDGWILLLPPDTKLEILLEFLGVASSYFSLAYERIDKLLQRKLKDVGLTFGIDKGELAKFQMNGQTEYIGRAINIASRLQGAIPGSRVNKVLCSQNCFHTLPTEDGTRIYEDKIKFKGSDRAIEYQNITVLLKNVAGGEKYDCLMWETLQSYQPEATVGMAILALIMYGFAQSLDKAVKPQQHPTASGK